jgi:hypothetical protein
MMIPPPPIKVKPAGTASCDSHYGGGTLGVGVGIGIGIDKTNGHSTPIPIPTPTPILSAFLSLSANAQQTTPNNTVGLNPEPFSSPMACGAAGRRCPTSREAPFLKLTAIGAGAKQSGQRRASRPRRRPRRRPRIVKSRTTTRTRTKPRKGRAFQQPGSVSVDDYGDDYGGKPRKGRAFQQPGSVSVDDYGDDYGGRLESLSA